MCGLTSAALSTVAVVSFGNGKHITLLTTEQQQGVLLWTTIAFCLGIMLLSIPKLAVVSLLTRILDPGRFHKWLLWIMVIWCQMSFLAAISILLGRCKPLRSMWDFSVKGTCFDINKLVSYGIYATGKTNSPNPMEESTLINVKSTRLSSISIWLFIQRLSSSIFRCP
jgi:hypothetical protein